MVAAHVQAFLKRLAGSVLSLSTAGRCDLCPEKKKQTIAVRRATTTAGPLASSIALRGMRHKQQSRLLRALEAVTAAAAILGEKVLGSTIQRRKKKKERVR